MKQVISFISLISLSKVAMLGATLVTSAVGADIILILGELFVFESNPYIGIATYMIFPGIAVMGLLLIPLGIFWKIKKLGGFKSQQTLTRVKQVNRLHVIQIVFGLSMLNLVIFGVMGYRGFHYTESKEFCGELCHTVMHPELNTYSRSPHSEISCVECHIGEGAKWFVKSKLSGVRQVLAVAMDTYSKPIQTPIHNLRPAREVCEVCHRPEIFHGDLIRVTQNFALDEKNTRTYTILNLRVGSGGEHGRAAHGIHWHVSKEHLIRYYATDPKRENTADPKRENIVWVEQQNSDGTTQVWTRPQSNFRIEDVDPKEIRIMDCVDCHNRPTHVFLPPDKAINEWMSDGRIDPSIPWIRKLSEEVLTKKYETRAAAIKGIGELTTLYQERHPEVWAQFQKKIVDTVPVLQDIHATFVYPEMKIEWNTYPSRLGHSTPHTAACFRCHNGVLRDDRGTPITLECEPCHFVLADNEPEPMILKILEDR